MVGLSERIATYFLFKDFTNERKDELYKRIEDLFKPEFEAIKSRLPNNYLLSSFYISERGKDLTVIINNPLHNGRLAGEDEVNRLNGILSEELKEIKRKYGFGVEFQLSVEMG